MRIKNREELKLIINPLCKLYLTTTKIQQYMNWSNINFPLFQVWRDEINSQTKIDQLVIPIHQNLATDYLPFHETTHHRFVGLRFVYRVATADIEDNRLEFKLTDLQKLFWLRNSQQSEDSLDDWRKCQQLATDQPEKLLQQHNWHQANLKVIKLPETNQDHFCIQRVQLQGDQPINRWLKSQ